MAAVATSATSAPSAKSSKSARTFATDLSIRSGCKCGYCRKVTGPETWSIPYGNKKWATGETKMVPGVACCRPECVLAYIDQHFDQAGRAAAQIAATKQTLIVRGLDFAPVRPAAPVCVPGEPTDVGEAMDIA